MVLGKAKVISFKEVQVKRAKKDKATAGKPKRGHKYKNPVLEADMLELKLELELELELEPKP